MPYSNDVFKYFLQNFTLSRRRNPLVANLLRRIHMVEGWGRGMPLILENEPTADFREVAQIFITTFRRKSQQGAENLSINPESGATIKTNTKTNTKTDTKTNTNKVAGVIREGSKEWQILEKISKNPGVSINELGNYVGLKRGGLRYHIDKLRKMGILSREGTKGGKWVVNFPES